METVVDRWTQGDAGVGVAENVVFSTTNSLAMVRKRLPDTSAGHSLVLALTLGRTIFNAEAVVAHHRRSIGRTERFVADSTEVLAVQRPLLEPANPYLSSFIRP